MTDQDDTVRDLAALVRAVLYGDRTAIVYAERITSRLGISEDDAPQTAEAALRKALAASPLEAAALHFADIWSELITALPDSYGCELNCPEANAAEGLWRAAGDDGTADALASAHAEHDDEGDEHHTGAGGRP